MTKNSQLVLIAITLITASCAITSGHNFPSQLNWITINKTTRNDVMLVLGKPNAIGSSSGTKTWTYSYYRYKIFTEPHYKELKIYWHNNYTVKNFSFSSSFTKDLKKTEL